VVSVEEQQLVRPDRGLVVSVEEQQLVRPDRGMVPQEVGGYQATPCQTSDIRLAAFPGNIYAEATPGSRDMFLPEVPNAHSSLMHFLVYTVRPLHN